MGMALTSCAEDEPNTLSVKKTSAREGRDRAVELVFNTAEQLDVTGWWPRNGAAWAQECTPESSHGRGDATASYSYDRWAPVELTILGTLSASQNIGSPSA